MPRRYDSADAKRRILSVCVRLFIENGYSKSTNVEILKQADVTSSTFYNIFHSKDGVLEELTGFMFENQFEMANAIIKEKNDPVLLYSVETAIQLTLAELNEHLREIYVEVYSQPRIAEIIYRKTTEKIQYIFSSYLPDYSPEKFFELEIGSSGIMRNYMAYSCNENFTLENKIHRFLEMSLKVYNVPDQKRKEVIDFIMNIDMVSTANAVMEKLFSALEMKYDFKLTNHR